MEPFFEQYPWLLVPLVIAIVEVWALVKAAIVRRWKQRDTRSAEKVV